MEKYLEKIKHILVSDKKTQNLLLVLVLIAVLLFSMSKINESNTNNGEKSLANSSVATSSSSYTANDNSLEDKLEYILGQIDGISEVSVMLNYSTTDKIIPVYDVKENIDEEKTDSRTSVTSVIEKNVAYQDNGSSKTPIVESTTLAVAEGAIVVAKGINIGENASKIKEAVHSVTGIATYKISVFEK